MTHPSHTTVRYEPCTAFRQGNDPLVCPCGWLEDDHAPGVGTGVGTGATVLVLRGRSRRVLTLPVRRAS